MTLLLKPAMLEGFPGPKPLLDVYAEEPADQVPRLHSQGVPLRPRLLVVSLRHLKHEYGHPKYQFSINILTSAHQTAHVP
jgi:hypothetical protein